MFFKADFTTEMRAGPRGRVSKEFVSIDGDYELVVSCERHGVVFHVDPGTGDWRNPRPPPD
jgi:hypothetical protein